MSRGFLIVAQTEKERRQATALAYSIKINNTNADISLVVGELSEVEESYEEPFDNIIELPFNSKIFSRSNDWQLWWVTPYENNIVIDCACIINTNIDSIWEYLDDNYDLCFPNKILDFRGDEAVHDKRYVEYTNYKLPELFTAWFYFKKNETSMEYFKLADPYMQNHIDVYNTKFEPQHVPNYFDTNLIHRILIKDSINDFCTDSILCYTDMDAVTTYYDRKSPKWTDYLNVWSRDSGFVKIQNYANTGLLYYKEDDFLTDDIFDAQRNSYRIKTKVLREV